MFFDNSILMCVLCFPTSFLIHQQLYWNVLLKVSFSYSVEDTDICYVLRGLQLKGKKK